MRTYRQLLTLASLALAAMLGAGPLGAQGITTGAIGGIITDDNGQPLEGAQVQVVNRATGYTTGALSRASGRYIVPGLEVGGAYAVTARRIGTTPETRENIVVTLGQETTVNFRLTTQAAVISGVEVTADMDQTFAATRTGVSTTISDSALRRLPTLNRNFTDFVTLTPQISTSGPGLSGGGVNNRYNSIQIDGANASDLFGLGATGQPGGQARGKSIPLDAVKEYQVLLTPFDVRQGNFAGALINAVTKSGTNDFLATAFYYTRNESLARDADFLAEFERTQYGFSLGGPIVKDRAHFFIAPEWSEETTPALGPYLGQPASEGTVPVDQTSVDAFRTALQGHGIEAGSGGLVNNVNPLNNLFARLDFALPSNNRLVLRHNYAYAEDDNFSRSNSGFRLTSNGYFFQSAANSSVAQLFSSFSNGGFNELQLNYITIRDRRTPNVASPQVIVRDVVPGTDLIAGSERFSMGNELDQDIIELREDYTQSFGSHRVTVGTQNQWFKIRNLFGRDSYGVYTFASIDSLELGLPEQYNVGVDLGGGIPVNMRAAQYSVYAQDVWDVRPGFTLTYGLRLDIPVLSSEPALNDTVLVAFGRNTQEVPSANVQYSPRVGFNWKIPGAEEQQLRGGVGLFVGRPAFVWLSNAYQNSGTGLGLFQCGDAEDATPGVVPDFEPDPSNQPTQCVDGSGPSGAGRSNLIDLLSPDLKFPQTMRFAIGYDRRLPYDVVASIEGLYTRNINDFFYENIGIDEQATLGPDGRVMYGTVGTNGRATVDYVRVGFRDVINVTNTSKNYSFNISTELRRRFSERLELRAAYAFSRVRDVQSPTSSQGISNWRFGRSIAGSHDAQSVGISLFDQPHKFVVSGSYTFPTKTDLSVIYVGHSGVPFDYVYNGDANADGVSTTDLLYVPTAAENTAAIFVDDADFGTAEVQSAAFEEFINGSECLSENRGSILERNGCRSPWQNRIDLSLRQRLPTIAGNEVALQIDVFNFTNLLNKDWGQQRLLPGGFSNVTVLRIVGATTADPATQQLLYKFNPDTERFTSQNTGSNYQIQAAVRYSFF